MAAAPNMKPTAAQVLRRLALVSASCIHTSEVSLPGRVSAPREETECLLKNLLNPVKGFGDGSLEVRQRRRFLSSANVQMSV